MPFELLTKEDLLIAAIATKRPVAFFVGSPLSLKDGSGVPGISEILTYVRDEIRGRAAFSLPKFESAVGAQTGADAYQESMKWLGSRMGQDAVNDVIKKAVLRARKAGLPEPTIGTDGQPDEWNIPAGTTGLAELATRGGEKFLGPILTTNFDPLISLAVRKSGGRAGRSVLAADGTLAGAAEDEPGICNVVHLHGFWRDSDTLHTQAQLTNPRPKLEKSLQRLLVTQRRTLVVAAYGGWDDVFTHALVDLMNDEQAQLDVIWCFYESDVIEVEKRYGKLLKAVAPAIVLNRFRAFGGIDCHSIFTDILTTLRGVPPTAVTPAMASPLAGWELVDDAYLGGLASLRPEEVIRYFDGATPTWRHATCADIPSRAAVAEIGRNLAEAQSSKTACSLQLIRAAGGEGKTTLLLQAAAAAAKSGDWNVLWRPTPRVGLPPEHVSTLDPAKHWLIVADDAENLVRDLSEASRLLHESGLFHVHFLLASRDTDWRHARGDRQSWATLLNQHPDIILRELQDDEAKMLVRAWGKYGIDGLRGLASLPSTDKQIATLLDAVNGGSGARDEGSFFGGLLTVRFGPDGLRNHVIALLTRLKGARIENSDRSLFDALLYVAACHAVGIPGLNMNVLADLVGAERDWVQTLVVNPLGEEAAAVQNSGHVLTRHSKVAATILVVAEEDFRIDVAEVWSAIVRQTVRTSQDVRIGDTFTQIVHAGPRLERTLPLEFSTQRRREIAVAAAKSAARHQSNWLGCIVDLGKTYRSAGDFAAAIRVFRDNLSVAPNKVDFTDVIRGYWYEWGISEGSVGTDASHRAADAWLQGLSLSDHLKDAPIALERAKLSFSGLGVAFGKLAEHRTDCPFGRARRSSAYLGRLTTSDPKALGYFNRYDREADKIPTPHPKDAEEAITWLTTAIAHAGRELQDPFLRAVLKPEQVSFDMLRDILKARMPKGAAVTQIKAPRSILSVPQVAVQARQAPPDPSQDVIAGIERVIAFAWSRVPENLEGPDRLKRARYAASDEISRISPTVKKRVGAYFETRKWQPLADRDPKGRL